MLKRIALNVAAAATMGAVLVLTATAAPPIPNSPPATQPKSSITLFEKPNFQGRSMTFQFGAASLNAVGFNDLAQSVKIEGPRDWVLCEGRNFLGRCIRVHKKEKDLKRQKFSALASSVYPVR